jgi:hypothetical protein
MNINEAGRYAKYLDGQISQLKNLFRNQNNFMLTTETHKRHEAYSEHDNKIVENVNERIFNCKIHDICHLMNKMIQHKLEVSLAMETAKRNLFIDWEENGQKLTVDSAIDYNNSVRGFAEYLNAYLLNQKGYEREENGKDYRFNIEGTQTPYVYKIEKVTTLDFDKNIVKELYKKSLEKADKISNLIELAKLKDSVNIEQIYSFHDTIEDIIQNYEKTTLKM